VTGVPGINHHEPNVDKCRPARSHSDRSPGSISLFPSLFLIFRSGLRPSPTARFARGEGSAFGRLTGALVSLLSGDALTAFGGGLRSAGSRFSGYGCRSTVLDSTPYGPFRSHRLPDLSSWTGGIVTPVISSQAPHHRLHRPVPRRPLHGLLVAGYWGKPPSCSFPRVSARRVEPGGTRCRPQGSR